MSKLMNPIMINISNLYLQFERLRKAKESFEESLDYYDKAMNLFDLHVSEFEPEELQMMEGILSMILLVQLI